MKPDGTTGNLTAQGTIGTEQQLLACLPLGIKSTAHLGAAKRTVVQQSAVLTGKRHALGHALVDNGTADLGQTIHIGLTGTVVATLDGVAEQAFHTVAVILVVLGRIDAALGGDAVGATGRILNTENVDIEAHGT